MNLAKIINQIIPRLVQEKIDLEFFHLKINQSGIKNYLIYINSILEILLQDSCKRVSLGLSPLVFSADFIDNALRTVYSKKKIPLIPLAGVDSQLFSEAKEIGLERNLKKLEKAISFSSDEVPEPAKKEVDLAIKSMKKLSIHVGPNNVHDILDSFEENH